jgi:prolyl 4-hydroxylase
MGNQVDTAKNENAQEKNRVTAGREDDIVDHSELMGAVQKLSEKRENSDGIKVDVIVEGNIWVVHGLLDASECKALIDYSESVGYEEATISTYSGPRMDKDTSNNWRCSIKDIEFSNVLFERIKHVVPAQHANRNAVGMNELFRFYKYSDGEYFRPHYDGCFRRNSKDQSYITAMIYLNEGFQGGETTFFDRRFGPENDETWKCVPKTGDCLLFLHKGWLHEGSELKSGTKYAIRSDIMYREE